jgi:dCMP deaminase
MSNFLVWDRYFLRIAREIGKKANCSSRKIGAVLTRDNCIISTGMNGSPMGIPHCKDRFYSFEEVMTFAEVVASSIDLEYIKDKQSKGHYKDSEENFKPGCPRRILGFPSGTGLSLCNAGHAERNALILAARNGIKTCGSTLVCYCGIPCKDCIIEIINAGVESLVCLKTDITYDNYNIWLLNNSNISVRTYSKEML